MSLYLGDCMDLLRSLPEASVDSVVCDPPYGLGFLGAAWDSAVPGVEWARECLRVLRPAGHLVAFGGTRTVHRLACAIEDGGFEIRDSIGWIYYSGFPKSLDVSKAIDAAAGVEREVVGPRRLPNGRPHEYNIGFREGEGFRSRKASCAVTAPATPAARQWSGWGTALKPAIEPAVLARKPLSGTVAATVLQHGTGALNIDGCRLAPGDRAWPGPDEGAEALAEKHASTAGCDSPRGVYFNSVPRLGLAHDLGRWPANIYHCPKAPRSERERGCADLPARTSPAVEYHGADTAALRSPRAGAGRVASEVRNHHPTCKPVRLMRWLCRLVTPPGGVVLDPFAGSGSTGVAAVLEGFRFAGAEREPDYHLIASARIAHAQRYPEAWADTAPGRDDEPVAEVEELERVGQARLFGGGE